MTAERDAMTLKEVSLPALGAEERSDETPRAGRARPTPDPEVVAKPSGASSVQSIDCGSWSRRSAARSPARWAACLAARGCTARI